MQTDLLGTAAVPVIPQSTLDTLVHYHLKLQEDAIHIQLTTSNGFKKSYQLKFAPMARPQEAVSEFVALTIEDFMQMMPCGSVDFSLDPAGSANPTLQEHLKFLKVLYSNTNAWIKRAPKDVLKNNTNICFVSYDDFSFLKDLHDRISKFPEGPKSTYIVFKSGWNNITRSWEQPEAFTPMELIQHCIKTKTGVIATNNHYLDDFYFHSGLYVPALIKHMGGEIVHFHFDIYDGTSYRLKKVFSDSNMRLFDCFPHVQNAWNEVYKMPRAEAIPVETFKDKKEITPIQDDVKVAVISNARIRDLFHDFRFVLSILGALPEKNMIDEFQAWYYAIRRILLRNRNLNRTELEFWNHRFYRIYLAGISFLKFVTISELSKIGKVDIFGDQEWVKLFPEAFTNRYLSSEESKAMFESGSHFRVLMNANYSYYENNPVFQTTLNYNSPFLCWAPLLDLPEHHGFKAIEYRDMSELKSKVPDIRKIWTNQDLLKARDDYYEFNQDVIHGLVEAVRFPNSGEKLLTRTCRSTEAFAEERLNQFERTSSLARDAYEIWVVKKEAVRVHPSNRFLKEPFVQRLLEIYQEIARAVGNA